MPVVLFEVQFVLTSQDTIRGFSSTNVGFGGKTSSFRGVLGKHAMPNGCRRLKRLAIADGCDLVKTPSHQTFSSVSCTTCHHQLP